MLDGSEFFVVLKLCSGEQVMAILREEEEDRILLETPMVMRSIPVLETGKEHITAHPLCQFSDDKMYVILKKDIMFCKRLHQVFIPHYMKIVKEHDQTSFISKEQKEELLEDWEDAEQMTVEEAKKRIQMLAFLLGREQEEQDDENQTTVVKGNNTLH